MIPPRATADGPWEAILVWVVLFAGLAALCGICALIMLFLSPWLMILVPIAVIWIGVATNN